LFGQDSLSYGQTFEIEGLECLSTLKWIEDLDEEQLNPKSSLYLDSIANFILLNPQAKFQLRCYTDVRGNDSVNLFVSQNRVNDWMKHLSYRGVDTNAIEGIALGEIFIRKVWLLDSVYLTQKPKGWQTTEIEIDLNEDYISTFITDNAKFEYLHQLNRRTELVVSELDEKAQRRVDYRLHQNQLYGDKHVEMIGPGTIQNTDTIRLNNKEGLYLHLVSFGTENEFTIQSLERPEEKYYYHLLNGAEDELLDISQAKGLYKIKHFGDAGFAEGFLFILH
jgi:hypothetical protein